MATHTTAADTVSATSGAHAVARLGSTNPTTDFELSRTRMWRLRRESVSALGLSIEVADLVRSRPSPSSPVSRLQICHMHPGTRDGWIISPAWDRVQTSGPFSQTSALVRRVATHVCEVWCQSACVACYAVYDRRWHIKVILAGGPSILRRGHWNASRAWDCERPSAVVDAVGNERLEAAHGESGGRFVILTQTGRTGRQNWVLEGYKIIKHQG